jgi:hypothetical protein
LVLSVDSQLDFADVLLLHTATEMACGVDLVVPTSVSGVPYDVVVQTDLRGVVWTLQLGPAVGRLDDRVISALGGTSTSLLEAGHGPVVHRGLALAGTADPRWAFKRDEGSALRALARDCTDALLDEGAWEVEPGLLRPELLDLADDPVAVVADLVHWLQTRTLEIGPTEIETLLELGALDAGAWARVADLGIDVWTAIQSLIEGAATSAPRDDGAAPRRLVTATHLEVRSRDMQLDVIRYLGLKEVAAA